MPSQRAIHAAHWSLLGQPVRWSDVVHLAEQLENPPPERVWRKRLLNLAAQHYRLARTEQARTAYLNALKAWRAARTMVRAA